MEETETPAHKLSLRYIIKNSIKLNSVSFLSAVIGFFVNIGIANALGPKQFGMASFVLLFLQYAGFVRLGFIYAGYREWIAERKKGNEPNAIKIQNIAITDEFLLSFLISILLFFAGFYFTDRFYRIGFQLASFILLLAAVDRIQGTVHISFERFNFTSRNRFIVAAIGPILSLLLVFHIGPYALLISPIIVISISIIIWFLFSPSIFYKPAWHSTITKELLLVGLPMGLSALVFTAFRMADRTVVALSLPSESLGYFSFASAIILAIALFINDFATVLNPVIWNELSLNGLTNKIASDIRRVCLYTILIIGLIINTIQAIINLPILNFVPKYVNSLPLISILAFNLISFQLMVIPDVILQSKMIQRQWDLFKLYTFGIILLLGGGLILVKNGWGLYGMAYVCVFIQGTIAFLGNIFIDKYLLHNKTERLIYYTKLALMISVIIIVYILLEKMNSVFVSNMFLGTSLNFLLVLIVWGSLIFMKSRGHNILSSVVERF
jgi:O-antigen/teichoic acid export membrane protein